MVHGHTSDTYEDVQVTYRPQLDTCRDGELMEMLPDYLVEEITFPLHQAAKFYSRVARSLTEVGRADQRGAVTTDMITAQS